MTKNQIPQVAVDIENEYYSYWKLNKAQLITVYRAHNRITSINPAEVTKDEVITQFLTDRHGERRMNIWREHYCK